MARAARRSSRKKSNVIKVNFKGVESRQGAVPEGEYPTEVTAVTLEEGQEHDYFKWEFTVDAGEYKGRKFFTNTSLSPNALWNLKYLLEQLGQEIPDDEMDIDPEELIGGQLNVIVEHETYEGRKRNVVVDYQEYNADGAGDEPEEEDEDEDDKKSSKKSSKKTRRGKAKEDDDEPEEEEEDDRPSRRKSKSEKKAKKKKKAGLTVDEVEDMSEDELADLVEEHELEVDLDKARTLSKKRNLVLDALEEAELLDEAA